MKYLKTYESMVDTPSGYRIIREEINGEEIILVNSNEESPLEKEFGIELNNNFLSSDEIYYNIYKGVKKLGFLVLSTERYNQYNFNELLGDKTIYLNFVRLNEKGFLREVINKLKEQLSGFYGYIVLEIGGRDYKEFKDLEKKYKRVGFKGVLPDDMSEYDLSLPDGIDPYEDDVFMYLMI